MGSWGTTHRSHLNHRHHRAFVPSCKRKLQLLSLASVRYCCPELLACVLLMEPTNPVFIGLLDIAATLDMIIISAKRNVLPPNNYDQVGCRIWFYSFEIVPYAVIYRSGAKY
jgi:hypothetical protein